MPFLPPSIPRFFPPRFLLWKSAMPSHSSPSSSCPQATQSRPKVTFTHEEEGAHKRKHRMRQNLAGAEEEWVKKWRNSHPQDEEARRARACWRNCLLMKAGLLFSASSHFSSVAISLGLLEQRKTLSSRILRPAISRTPTNRTNTLED